MRFAIDTEFHEDGHTIDLISIGIVAQDGREFYAENKDSLFLRAVSRKGFKAEPGQQWLVENVVPRLLGGEAVKTKATIAAEVLDFVGEEKPEFWAYCSAYDWVALCQLFGPMVALPGGWPYYCNDIAQWARDLGCVLPPVSPVDEHNALVDAHWVAAAYRVCEGAERGRFAEYKRRARDRGEAMTAALVEAETAAHEAIKRMQSVIALSANLAEGGIERP